MKKSLLILLFALSGFCVFSQNLVFSPLLKEDDRNINFEVIGKVGDKYHIFKNIRNRFVVEVLDNNMQLVSNDRLDFLSDRTINADFVAYPTYYWIVYQYQRNSVVFCKAAKINADGKIIGVPLSLDSTNIGLINSNRIYNLTYSEDKSQILLYKLYRRNSKYHVVAKRYNADMALQDSTRYSFTSEWNDDEFSDFVIANDGTEMFGKHLKKGFRDYIDNLQVFSKLPEESVFYSADVPIDKNVLIEVVQIKPDNANKRFLINSFYYPEKRGNIQGLFSVSYNAVSKAFKSALIPFADTTRNKFSNTGLYRSAFNNLMLRNIFVKRDGSFMFLAEDYSTFTSGINPYNRWNYGNLYGPSYMYDYYLFNRYYYNFYRPYGFYNNRVRFDYDNLLVGDVDSTLRGKWEEVIYKKQSDEETDNFLSYAVANAGSEVYILFRESDKNNYAIANQSISPNGLVTRYPTLKSMNTKYDFMPRMAKQVGLRELIIPAMYRGRVVFAKATLD